MNICDSVLIRAAPALSQSLHIQTIYQLLPASCGVPRHQLQTDLSFSPLSFSLRMGSDVACPTVSTSPPVHPHICRDMCSTPQWSRTNDNYDIHPLWRLEIVQLSCPLFIIFPKSVFFFFSLIQYSVGQQCLPLLCLGQVESLCYDHRLLFFILKNGTFIKFYRNFLMIVHSTCMDHFTSVQHTTSIHIHTSS